MNHTGQNLENQAHQDSKLDIVDVNWGPHEASVDLNIRDQKKRVYFKSSEMLSRGTDFLLPLLLLPSMSVSTPLELPNSTSPRLLKSVSKLQDVFASWDTDRYQRIPVTTSSDSFTLRFPVAMHASRKEADGTACFFSGGVDSFYSALKHRDEITHLILIHGFDLRLHSRKLRDEVSRALREAAAQLGKPLIEVETNLRQVSDPLVPWEQYHGGALASIALLLQDLLGKAIVPATRTYARLLPWGTHPILDPLWSTETLEFEHDGCEATRSEKVASIAASEPAMNNLRVCLTNAGGSYNCGTCEKCVRTMLNLKAVGALEKCRTLPDVLDLKAVEQLPYEGERLYAWASENLRVVERYGVAPELIPLLRQAQKNSKTEEVVALRKALDDMKIAYRTQRNNVSAARVQSQKVRTQNKGLREQNRRLREANRELRERTAGNLSAILRRLVRDRGLSRFKQLVTFLKEKRSKG